MRDIAEKHFNSSAVSVQLNKKKVMPHTYIYLHAKIKENTKTKMKWNEQKDKENLR